MAADAVMYTGQARASARNVDALPPPLPAPLPSPSPSSSACVCHPAGRPHSPPAPAAMRTAASSIGAAGFTPSASPAARAGVAAQMPYVSIVS